MSSHLGKCGIARAFSVLTTSATQSRALPVTFFSSSGDEMMSMHCVRTGSSSF